MSKTKSTILVIGAAGAYHHSRIHPSCLRLHEHPQIGDGSDSIAGQFAARQKGAAFVAEY